MSSEDFPALPGTQNREGPSPGGSMSGDKTIPVGLGPEIGQDVLQANRAPGSEKSQSSKRGIQTSPDGKIRDLFDERILIKLVEFRWSLILIIIIAYTYTQAR